MHEGDGRLEEFKTQVKNLCLNADESSCAPLLMRDIDGIHRKIFGGGIDYSKEKTTFNRALLDMEDELYAQIAESDEPLKTAVSYAMSANYIDYARLSHIDADGVKKVISAASKTQVDDCTYEQLKTCLSKAKTLAYLHDNCGEIALDKLLIRVITQNYPQIDCVSVVRGGDIINDVTVKDAYEVGLDKYARIIDNGTAIPATYLKEINETTKRLIETSDVIISKGLGNLETLYGEGYRIFYMFMCKCEHIAARFNKRVWETAFIEEN